MRASCLTARSHYLTQYRYWYQSINVFENCAFKMAAMSPRSQWVNENCLWQGLSTHAQTQQEKWHITVWVDFHISLQWIYSKLHLPHCGLVTSYGNINLGEQWFKQWLVAWWHQAITWANVDLSPMEFCGIYQRAISCKFHANFMPNLYKKVMHTRMSIYTYKNDTFATYGIIISSISFQQYEKHAQGGIPSKLMLPH